MKRSTKKALIDLIQNSAIVLLELILSIVCGSCSALTNTLHDLTDCTTTGLGILTPKIKKENTRKYSVLCLVATSAFLLVTSGAMLAWGVYKISHTHSINGWVMVLASLIGVIFNGMLALRNKEEDTIDLHALEDVIGWIAVLVLSLMVAFFHWYVLDGIVTILLALYYIFHIGRNLYEVFLVLTNTTTETIVAEPRVAELVYTQAPALPEPVIVLNHMEQQPEAKLEDAEAESTIPCIQDETSDAIDIAPNMEEEAPIEVETLVEETTTIATIDLDTTDIQPTTEEIVAPQEDFVVAIEETPTEQPTIVALEEEPSSTTIEDTLPEQDLPIVEEMDQPIQLDTTLTDQPVEIDQALMDVVAELEDQPIQNTNEKVHGKLSSIMGNLDNLLSTQTQQTTEPIQLEEEVVEEESKVTDEYLQALFDNIIARKEERIRNKQSN